MTKIKMLWNKSCHKNAKKLKWWKWKCYETSLVTKNAKKTHLMRMKMLWNKSCHEKCKKLTWWKWNRHLRPGPQLFPCCFYKPWKFWFQLKLEFRAASINLENFNFISTSITTLISCCFYKPWKFQFHFNFNYNFNIMLLL